MRARSSTSIRPDFFNLIAQAQNNDKDMKKVGTGRERAGSAVAGMAAVLVSAGISGDEIVIEASLQAGRRKKAGGSFYAAYDAG